MIADRSIAVDFIVSMANRSRKCKILRSGKRLLFPINQEFFNNNYFPGFLNQGFFLAANEVFLVSKVHKIRRKLIGSQF